MASSFTLHRAERAARRRAARGRCVTAVLGVVFVGTRPWSGRRNASASTNAYGTIYYALTGFHGLHVVVGLVLLAIVGLAPPDVAGSVPGLAAATSWYWHFVDVVWVRLFATIFLVR